VRSKVYSSIGYVNSKHFYLGIESAQEGTKEPERQSDTFCVSPTYSEVPRPQLLMTLTFVSGTHYEVPRPQAFTHLLLASSTLARMQLHGFARPLRHSPI